MERALRRDRALVLGTLLGIVVVCWGYLWTGAGTLHEMGGMLMPMSLETWTPAHALLMLAMWVAMMTAMMLPSAAPMILLYAMLSRGQAEKGGWGRNTSAFVLGYLALWTIFSMAAVVLQFSLQRATLLSPMMRTNSTAFAGMVLIATGLYQLTSLKHNCLRRCRSPLDFMLTQWCHGMRGAFVMGARHGAYCIGCCSALMLLLFVGGIMNLAWIAGLALIVLLEKCAPGGQWISRIGGLILFGWGAILLIQR